MVPLVSCCRMCGGFAITDRALAGLALASEDGIRFVEADLIREY